MRLVARLARRASRSGRAAIVAAALRSAQGRSAQTETLLDRELPASSMLTALHFRETSPRERAAANNGNFSGPSVL